MIKIKLSKEETERIHKEIKLEVANEIAEEKSKDTRETLIEKEMRR